MRCHWHSYQISNLNYIDDIPTEIGLITMCTDLKQWKIGTELCWTGPEETDTQYGLDWADPEETDTQYGLYWADIVGCALGRTSGRQLRAHHYTRAFDFDPVGACPVAADVVSEKRQRDPFASPVPCSVSRWRRRLG